MINSFFPFALFNDREDGFERWILGVLQEVKHGTLEGSQDASILLHPTERNASLPCSDACD